MAKRPHTLADHAYGMDHDHSHDELNDHDHDHEPAGPLEENAIWQQDNITLTSVGIDIGSAGTQVIFSRLRMRRMGEDLSSRYFVVGRDTLYQSPVALTPYASDVRITRLDPAGEKLARGAGFHWQLASRVTPAELERLTDWLAETLCAAIVE